MKEADPKSLINLDRCVLNALDLFIDPRTRFPRPNLARFGRENAVLGKERLNLPLPKNPTYPAIMAVGYYVIGKLQAQKPAWFKQSIGSYADRASQAFGQTIKLIAEFR